MNSLYEVLNNPFLQIVVSSGASTILAIFIIKRSIGSAIDGYFQKRVEDYKYQLNTLTEALRFDYERKIHNFGLFTSKKHEIYMELNKLLLIADGKVRGLMGLRHVPDYWSFSLEDIQKFIGPKNFMPSIKDKILSNWESNKRLAIDELEKYLRNIEFHEARTAVFEAKNYFWFSQLYLSDDVISHSKKLLDRLSRLRIHYEIPDRHQKQEKIDQLETEITESLDNTITTMRKELGIGDYSVGQHEEEKPETGHGA